MQAEQLSLFDNTNEPLFTPCPLLGKKVVVTGSFTQGRQSLRSTLLRLGASEVRYDKLQRNTHFFLTGDNPDIEAENSWRTYVHDGYNIRRISAEDLEKIQNGIYAPYQMPDEIIKELHITQEHLYWVAPEISSLKNLRQVSPISLDSNNVLYNLEIYIHHSILAQKPNLAQALGCLGAYANTDMDDNTNCILTPKDLPQEICRTVEEYYNNSHATQFNIPFLILEDLLRYLEQRAKDFPDEIFSALL